jgi:hypothetical protein
VVMASAVRISTSVNARRRWLRVERFMDWREEGW